MPTTLGWRAFSTEPGGVDVGMQVGLVGMDADRRHDVILALGRADHRVPFAGAGRDVEHEVDPGRPRPRQHRRLVLDQALIVEVAVAIDEHG